MVKINTKLVEDTLKIQTLYEAWIDFDATIEELRKLGYCPKRYSAGRPRKDGLQQQDAGNLTFTLKSGAKVNVSPKGQPHKIQVSWNFREEKEKQFCELTNVLMPFKSEELFILPLHSIRIKTVWEDQDEILDKIFLF